ncbi:hypothetical protein EAG08_19880 [Chryseobacterium sp. 3008163]|nr:hypothetical protein EAG08_19880 [Chryseobacterium sp. 3008163]
MKKLIIFNFIFLILLNAVLIAKEIFFASYSSSRYEDFTYINVDNENSFSYGVFRVSIWWMIYFLLLSITSIYILQYLKSKFKKIQFFIVMILFQIIVCYLINELILRNIFGFFQLENILTNIISITIFWYLTIFKFSKAS